MGNGLAEPSKTYDSVMESLGGEESEEKPFWAKFLQSDFQKEEPKPLLPMIMDVLAGNATVDEL
jgi:hypothetical protein